MLTDVYFQDVYLYTYLCKKVHICSHHAGERCGCVCIHVHVKTWYKQVCNFTRMFRLIHAHPYTYFLAHMDRQAERQTYRQRDVCVYVCVYI